MVMMVMVMSPVVMMMVVVPPPMVMMVVVMSPMMMMVVMVMSPMVMVIISRELHFYRWPLRPRGIIGLECLQSVGNRVQKFCVGTGA
jgi:hypothetical protein